MKNGNSKVWLTVLLGVLLAEASWSLHQLHQVREDVAALKVQVSLLLRQAGLASYASSKNPKCPYCDMCSSARGECLSGICSEYRTTQRP